MAKIAENAACLYCSSLSGRMFQNGRDRLLLSAEAVPLPLQRALIGRLQGEGPLVAMLLLRLCFSQIEKVEKVE